MRKRLNFITVLICVAIGVMLIDSKSVSEFTDSFMEGFKEGFEEGFHSRKKGGKEKEEKKEKEAKKEKEIFMLTLKPVVKFAKPSALLNLKSGEPVSARIDSVVVELPKVKKSGWHTFGDVFFTLLFLAGLVMCIFNFLKIIFAVNKSVIFEWCNVKRLRRTGIGFILIFVAQTGFNFVDNHFTVQLIDLADYNIKNQLFEGGTLLLGMISLLIAEVFAVGLRLKEEQELTI